MNNLTYGRKEPEDGDKGAQFWDALSANTVLDDAHTHDGVNSSVLSSKHMTRGAVAVTGSGWSASGTRIRKTVTVPTGWSLSSSGPVFLLNASGDRIYPHYERITATSFYLYMPVDNLAVDCLFT